MSAVAVEGPHALAFLELVMANTAARLVDNEAQYSYILRENGVAFDDAYVYRFGEERYMVVVNAGNYEQDMAWFEAVNQVTAADGRCSMVDAAPWWADVGAGAGSSVH